MESLSTFGIWKTLISEYREIGEYWTLRETVYISKKKKKLKKIVSPGTNNKDKSAGSKSRIRSWGNRAEAVILRAVSNLC